MIRSFIYVKQIVSFSPLSVKKKWKNDSIFYLY